MQKLKLQYQTHSLPLNKPWISALFSEAHFVIPLNDHKCLNILLLKILSTQEHLNILEAWRTFYRNLVCTLIVDGNHCFIQMPRTNMKEHASWWQLVHAWDCHLSKGWAEAAQYRELSKLWDRTVCDLMQKSPETTQKLTVASGKVKDEVLNDSYCSRL